MRPAQLTLRTALGRAAAAAIVVLGAAPGSAALGASVEGTQAGLAACLAARGAVEDAVSLAKKRDKAFRAEIAEARDAVREAITSLESVEWPADLLRRERTLNVRLRAAAASLGRAVDWEFAPGFQRSVQHMLQARRLLSSAAALLQEVAPQEPAGQSHADTPAAAPVAPPVAAADFQWTDLNPSADSRIIYCSSSDGNDANDGLAPTRAVKSPKVGYGKLRNGFPDWLLFKRGDTWVADRYSNQIGLAVSGRSAQEPIVISSYGSSTARPKLLDGQYRMLMGQQTNNVAVVGLHFERTSETALLPDGFQLLGYGDSFLIEDCYVAGYMTNINVQARNGQLTNFKVRGCVVVDAFTTTGAHSQGMLLDNAHGVLIEGCVFDHNGWKEGVTGAEATIFNHNMYLSYTSSNLTLKNTITANASSHGASHPGGTCEDSLFVANPVGLFFRDRGTVRRNVFLDSRDIGTAPRGFALWLGYVKGIDAYENIIAHQTTGKQPVGINVEKVAESLTLRNNIVYDWGSTTAGANPPIGINITAGGTGTNSITGNTVVQPSGFVLSHALTVNTGVFTHAGNHYQTGDSASRWFYNGGSVMGLSTWATKSGENDATTGSVPYVAPDRSVGSYHGTIGGTATLQAFLAEARKQSKANWRPAYTASAVNTYIREGFAIQ